MKKQVGKAWKRFFGVVMALMMVIGVIAPTAATVRAAEGPVGHQYPGGGESVHYTHDSGWYKYVQDGTLGDTGSIPVTRNSNPTGQYITLTGEHKEVALCANVQLSAQDKFDNVRYRLKAKDKWDNISDYSGGTALDEINYFNSSAYDSSEGSDHVIYGDELYNKVARCLYYGFPCNAAGFKEGEGDILKGTQGAVYLAMSFGGDTSHNSAISGDLKNSVYEELVKIMNDSSKTVPADFELYVYVSNYSAGTGLRGQNLLGCYAPTVEPAKPKVAVYLRGKKELKGGQLKDQQFSFTISGENVPAGQETKVNYGSDIWFPEITFDTVGDYTYTIKEVKGNDSTITYDEKEKTFTVNVTQEGEKLIASVDGKQIATSDDKKDDGTPKAGEIDGSVDKYKFVNEVKTEDEPTEPTVKTKVNPNEVEAKANAEFTDTVTLTNLTEGVEYTITGQLMDKEAQEKVEATCEPVKFTASAEDAAAASVEKEMKFTFDATNFVGKELVVFETLSWKEGDETKKVPHTDYEDADQTITVKEPTSDEPTEPTDDEPTDEDRTPKIATTVTAGSKEASADNPAQLTYDEISGKTVSVVDTINYEGLISGVKYTVKGTLVEVSGDGKEKNTVMTVEKEMEETTDATGSWTLEFGELPLKAYAKYVVFEEAYAAEGEDEKATKEKPLEHKDVNDKAQTILTEDTEGVVMGDSEDPTFIGKIGTTVSAGGKTATADKEATLTAAEAEKVTTVTDTVKYSNFQPGDIYKVTGTLMKVKGTEVSQVGDAVTVELTANDSGEGTVPIKFSNVKLEAGCKYVVFEKAENTDVDRVKDTAIHADINDKAQTIVVEAKKAAAPSKAVASPKTGDTNQPLLWIGLLAAAACAGVVLVRKRRA